ncbi:MAG: hypothetical protein NVSMB64_05930 [Candidatus Velthaea sp.]
MAHTLEELQPGTPVFAGEVHVADVRAVYAAQGSRAADMLVIRWLDRNEDVALPAGEVESVDDGGVHLMDNNPHSYAALAPFDAARFPTVHPLL